MTAKGGASLLADQATTQLKRRLIPIATLITPNIPEAERLTGLTITDEATMHHAAETLLSLGAQAVLLKGGHLDGPDVIDILKTPAETHIFRAPKINSRHTHGTGCTLASAIATGLAQHQTLAQAVHAAQTYVQAAIQTAPQLGHGHGPLNHIALLEAELAQG
jgi:hydroxymethylpyrimidine/phosphomethylpyrimidine kinase